MDIRRTPPLSFEGSREVKEEMSRPPKDTPARRDTMERVRAMEERLKELALDEASQAKR